MCVCPKMKFCFSILLLLCFQNAEAQIQIDLSSSQWTAQSASQSLKVNCFICYSRMLSRNVEYYLPYLLACKSNLLVEQWNI